jgi:DNA-binding response OmpR family regulator
VPRAATRRRSLEDAIVMLVDDEPTTLDVLEMYLEAAGYRNLVSLSDATRVLAALAARPPDALLLNVVMPEVDGFEILAAMRADATLAAIPVIVLTSSSDPEVKRRALALGASDFLSKPIDPSELALRLRNTLGASAARAEGCAAPAPRLAGDPLVSRLAAAGPRMQRILQSFALRLEQKLEEMDACAAAGDLEALASLAHWLKGAAGTVGYDDFAEPAEALRKLARGGKADEVGTALRALHELAGRIVADGGAGASAGGSA